MKYFPLLWAALMRKPARAILTLLSVAVAFTLFGLMIGLDATFDKVESMAKADFIYTWPRFGGQGPIAMGREIAAMPGVAKVSANGGIPGYIRDPKNHIFVAVFDENGPAVWQELPFSAQQWRDIHTSRTGVIMSKMQAARWHKKVGDTLTVISPSTVKADGTKSWDFKVLGITDDVTTWSDGYVVGDYDYLDKGRRVSDQGKIFQFAVLTSDPDRSTEIAGAIDAKFANSATPLQSMTQKMAYATSNAFGGLDVKAVTRDISLAGLFMILFLTANGIAQSVRERFAEFATLKTIGFSDSVVVMLVVLEAAVPCVAGAALGVGIAAWLARQLPGLMPPGFGLPVPTMAPMVFLWAAVAAAIVALASAALPAIRLAKMDIATALSGRT